jgi:hypothetical protein
MTAYARALEAVDALSVEDLPIFAMAVLDRVPVEPEARALTPYVRALVARLDIGDAAYLFRGRSQDEMTTLLMHLHLGYFDLDWKTAALWVLIEKLVDRADRRTLQELVRMGEWLDGHRDAGEREA